MKIAFIGGGNMGEAMLSGLLDKNLGAAKEMSLRRGASISSRSMALE